MVFRAGDVPLEQQIGLAADALVLVVTPGVGELDGDAGRNSVGEGQWRRGIVALEVLGVAFEPKALPEGDELVEIVREDRAELGPLYLFARGDERVDIVEARI